MAKIDTFKFSFFPRTIAEWNTLHSILMFTFLMLISFYLFIYLFIYLSILLLIIIYLFFILYILWTVGVIPFKVLPTLINVNVNVNMVGHNLVPRSHSVTGNVRSGKVRFPACSVAARPEIRAFLSLRMFVLSVVVLWKKTWISIVFLKRFFW